MADTSTKTISLMACEFASLRESEVVETILQALTAGQAGWVLTANLDILRRWVNDPAFRQCTSAVNLCIADGAPVVWASRLQGSPLPERVAGSDLVSSLSAALAPAGHSVFLLGGAPGTAERAAELLQQRYPGLRVAGSACPAPGFEQSEAQMSGLTEQLRRAAPDVVYVALGSPKQERLIEALRTELPHAWWLGIGASFSFLTGDIQRAPQWMQAAGLEWLHRMAQEPRRLFKRYIVDDLPFMLRLFANALVKRFARP